MSKDLNTLPRKYLVTVQKGHQSFIDGLPHCQLSSPSCDSNANTPIWRKSRFVENWPDYMNVSNWYLRTHWDDRVYLKYGHNTIGSGSNNNIQILEPAMKDSEATIFVPYEETVVYVSSFHGHVYFKGKQLPYDPVDIMHKSCIQITMGEEEVVLQFELWGEEYKRLNELLANE